MRSNQCHSQSTDGKTESQRGKPPVKVPPPEKGSTRVPTAKSLHEFSEPLLIARHCAGTGGRRAMSSSPETLEVRIITKG